MMYLVWYLVAGFVSVIAFTIGVEVRAEKKGYDVIDYLDMYTDETVYGYVKGWLSYIYIALWTAPTTMLMWPVRLLVIWRKLTKVDKLYELLYKNEEEEL